MTITSNIKETLSTKIMKISLGFLGFFMLIPGLVKFTDPFKTFFITQIDKAELPFPLLTRISGQASEILTGLVLFALVFSLKKIDASLIKKLFFFSQFLLSIILIVALYVHWHPAVPAEVLPFEEKFPYLTIAMLLAVAYNLFKIKKTN